MKFALSHARALLLGVALIVVTNAVVLAGVAYNRSGEPESSLQLTERELRIRRWSWPSNDNSSIDLYLNWRIAEIKRGDDEYRDDEYEGGMWYHGLAWLKPEQLRELGFEVDGDLESKQVMERIRRQPSRRAWIVLELDGPAYQASLERARQKLERATTLASANPGDREFQGRLNSARDSMNREENTATRLFVVDAGPDEDALRTRYPDRKRYVILSGRLMTTIEGPEGRKRLVAQLARIDVDVIRVPHAYRSLVESYVQAGDGYADRKPRFTANVSFGRRFEPWIVDLSLLE